MATFDDLDKAVVNARGLYDQTVSDRIVAENAAAALSTEVQTVTADRDHWKAEAARLQTIIDNAPPVVDPPPSKSRKPVIPKGAVWLGMSIDPDAGETRAKQLSDIEKDLGRKLATVHYFVDADVAKWPKADIEADVAAGRIPHISIKFGDWDAVAKGSLDKLINAAAAYIKGLKGGVLVTFHHEPTNDGAAAKFVAHWNHCFDMFTAAGVDNALYMPVMIAFDLGGNKAINPDDWLLGLKGVDLLGADPYNWAPTRPGSTWTLFSKIARFAEAHATKMGKRLFIAETGTNENTVTNPNKAAWLADMFAEIKASPVYAGVQYFSNVHTNSGPPPFVNDWRYNTTPAAAAAFKRGAADPYFGAMRDKVA